MIRVLVPVDGSSNSDRAVRHVVRLTRLCRPLQVHLLNVQEPIDSLQVRRFKLPREIRRLQFEHGASRLRRAKRMLDRARVRYEAHVLIGNVPETIVRLARRKNCGEIVMGTRGMGALGNLLLGSVANKVIHLARVPVNLVK